MSYYSDSLASFLDKGVMGYARTDVTIVIRYCFSRSLRRLLKIVIYQFCESCASTIGFTGTNVRRPEGTGIPVLFENSNNIVSKFKC
jgi:hypothetical protein